jgi:hypothetical protein
MTTPAFELGFRLGTAKAALFGEDKEEAPPVALPAPEPEPERSEWRKQLFPHSETRLLSPAERILGGLGYVAPGAAAGGLIGGLGSLGFAPLSEDTVANIAKIPEGVKMPDFDDLLRGHGEIAQGPAGKAMRGIARQTLRAAGKGALVGGPLAALLAMGSAHGRMPAISPDKPHPLAME